MKKTLARARAQAGLTQAELAKKIGVDPTYISHLEHGRREPSLTTLRAWAKACGHKLVISLESRV